MFLVLGSVSFFPIRLTSIHKGWNAVPSGRTEHQPQDGGVQDEMCAALEVPESHLGRVTGKVTLLTESAKQLVGFQSRCCPPSTSRGSHCPDPGPLSVPPSAIRGVSSSATYTWESQTPTPTLSLFLSGEISGKKGPLGPWLRESQVK